jgi:hypothetical protein
MENLEILNLKELDSSELVSFNGGGGDAAETAGNFVGWCVGFVVFGVAAFAVLGAKAVINGSL